MLSLFSNLIFEEDSCHLGIQDFFAIYSTQKTDDEIYEAVTQHGNLMSLYEQKDFTFNSIPSPSSRELVSHVFSDSIPFVRLSKYI